MSTSQSLIGDVFSRTDWSAWAAIFAGLAFAASLVAIREARLGTLRSLLQEQMGRYLEAYWKLAQTGVDHTAYHYAVPDANKPNKQMQNQIVMGQLICLVDLMFDARDPRATIWLGYLAAFEGPIWDCKHDVLAYARRPETRDELRRLQVKVRAVHPTGQLPTDVPNVLSSA